MNIENCLICSDKTRHEVLLKANDFYITKCHKCKLISQRLHISSDRLKEVYDNVTQYKPIYGYNSRDVLRKFNKMLQKTWVTIGCRMWIWYFYEIIWR